MVCALLVVHCVHLESPALTFFFLSYINDVEKSVTSQHEKRRQIEVYLMLDNVTWCGKAARDARLGLCPPLSRMKEHKGATGERPLKMLESREVLVCVRESLCICRGLQCNGVFRLTSCC